MRLVKVIVSVFVKDSCDPEEVVEYVQDAMASHSGGSSEVWNVKVFDAKKHGGTTIQSEGERQ